MLKLETFFLAISLSRRTAALRTENHR